MHSDTSDPGAPDSDEALRLERALDSDRFSRDHAQEILRRLIELRAALFPIPQRADRML
jgi:hypothetical protein